MVKFNFASLEEKPKENVIDKPTQKPKRVITKTKTQSKKVPTSPTTTDFGKLTMDEIRAYYIIICKKKPKHDSTHTKDFLVSEIINKLELSK